MRFSNFILKEAVAASHRVGLAHLEKMAPLHFLELISELKAKHGGKLSDKTASISEKVDGSGFRFGMSKDGQTYIESSHSGPMFHHGSFSARSIEKNQTGIPGQATQWAIEFDKVLAHIKADKPVLDVLKKYNTNGVKVVGELFLNPIGEHDGDTISFVKIKYDKAKLGKYFTAVLFAVLDDEGKPHPKANEIIKALKAASNADVKFDDVHMQQPYTVDVSVDIENALKVFEKHGGKANIEKVFGSRTKSDLEKRKVISSDLEKHQVKMAGKLLKPIKQGKFGKDYEGVVFNVKGAQPFKVTSTAFRTGKLHARLQTPHPNNPVKKIRESLMEGGHAVSNVGRINQENAMATYTAAVKELARWFKVSPSDFRSLGSTGKKAPGESSGDMDMALSLSRVMEANHLQTKDQAFDLIVRQARAHGHESKDMRSLSIVSLAWPIVNLDGKQAGQNVQADIMLVDNVDQAAWSFYAPHFTHSKLKGLFRNYLIIYVARESQFKVTMKHGDEDAEWTRLIYDMGKGLFKGKQSRLLPSGKLSKNAKTVERSHITNDPDEIVKILFGSKFKANDILTFEGTLKAIMSPEFKWAAKRQHILRAAAEAMEREGHQVPDQLKRALT